MSCLQVLKSDLYSASNLTSKIGPVSTRPGYLACRVFTVPPKMHENLLLGYSSG